MFDISPDKLFVVAAIAFAVLGPDRIPAVARSLGRARSHLRELTAMLPAEAVDAVRQPRQVLMNAVAEPHRVITEMMAEPKAAVDDAMADFRFTVAPTPENGNVGEVLDRVAPVPAAEAGVPHDVSFN